MTASCPACASPRTIRHESLPDREAYARSGDRIERVPCPAARLLCKACGKTFVLRDEGTVAAERQARDHLAERAFRLGRAGAAREAGVTEKVVERLLRDWRQGREPDIAGCEPDFLLLQPASHRGEGRILVVDADAEALVEVLQDRSAVAGWLADPGRVPALRVCVPLDPGLAELARNALPGTVVMVAPSAVRRAIRLALAAGLNGLRRLGYMRGRNAMPGTARFLRAHDGRVEPGEGWPREVLSLLRAGRLASGIVDARAPAEAERSWREFELAADTEGGRPLARMMATWRREILAGLANRFIDRVAGIVDGITRQARARRPALAFEDFRALVLLRDAEGPGRGRALAGLRERLGPGL